jgi:hypothetical protein
LTLSLSEQLDLARRQTEIRKLDAGDRRVATELKLDIPKPALAKDVLERFDIFGKWCASKQARKCPAKPKTVAAFVLAQHELGATAQVILSILAAVEALHNFHGLSNPVQTAIVRAALDTIIKVDLPRGWSVSERVEFALLPPDVRQIILDKERLRDKAVRRAQNEAAELRKRHSGAETKPVQTEKEVTL